MLKFRLNSGSLNGSRRCPNILSHGHQRPHQSNRLRIRSATATIEAPVAVELGNQAMREGSYEGSLVQKQARGMGALRLSMQTEWAVLL